MKEKQIITHINEEKIVLDCNIFDNTDKEYLLDIYKQWVDLSNKLELLNGKRINVPDVLSEGLFCIHMESIRTLKEGSFDAFNEKTHERIQIKACSVKRDLTSFGPKSIWDKLYLMMFNVVENKITIYHIPNNLIYSHKVNKEQTFIEQQKQGRRPRFSIYGEIILKKDLKPIKIIQL